MKRKSYKRALIALMFWVSGYSLAMESRQENAVSFKYGINHLIGRRPTMEDAHAVHLAPDEAFFAIFDGHGGAKVAHYCAQNAYRNIKQVEGDIPTKLTKGLERLHDLIADSDLKAIAKTCGSCAIAALIKDNKIYVANVGDSRAVLSNNGVAKALSEDHKPDRPDELERIINAGGTVEVFGVPRVGGLAVSRAIGDLDLNKLGVIAVPEIREIALEHQHDFLILACDGIFEQNMSNQDAVTIVKRSLAKNRENPKAEEFAAQDLVQAAYAKGSMDNLSAIVITFNTTKMHTETADQKLLRKLKELTRQLKQVHSAEHTKGYSAINFTRHVLEQLCGDLASKKVSKEVAVNNAVWCLLVVQDFIAKKRIAEELYFSPDHGILRLQKVCDLVLTSVIKWILGS